jgi:hypothetical protein
MFAPLMTCCWRGSSEMAMGMSSVEMVDSSQYAMAVPSLRENTI